MKKIFAAVSFSAAALLLNACAPDQSKPVSEAPQINTFSAGGQNAYEQPALALLSQKCGRCHTPTAGPKNVKDIANTASLVSSGQVIPGQPLSSPLFLSITSGKMPPGNVKFTEEETKLIENFILSLEPSGK